MAYATAKRMAANAIPVIGITSLRDLLDVVEQADKERARGPDHASGRPVTGGYPLIRRLGRAIACQKG